MLWKGQTFNTVAIKDTSLASCLPVPTGLSRNRLWELSNNLKIPKTAKTSSHCLNNLIYNPNKCLAASGGCHLLVLICEWRKSRRSNWGRWVWPNNTVTYICCFFFCLIKFGSCVWQDCNEMAVNITGHPLFPSITPPLLIKSVSHHINFPLLSGF